MIDTLYGPAMFVLGGATVLICLGLYAWVTVPRPRLRGFDIDREGRELHRHLAGKGRP